MIITQNVKKLQGANTFNPTEYLTNNVTYSTGSTDVNTEFKVSDFVRKSGDFIDGNLVMTGTSKIIFSDGSEQHQAFNDSNMNAISNAQSKTQYINTLSNVTTISSDLSVLGQLNINDNSLQYNKINGLSSTSTSKIEIFIFIIILRLFL
jgi:hypothetical protein